MIRGVHTPLTAPETAIGSSLEKDLDETYRGFALSSAEVSARFKKNGVSMIPSNEDPMRILINNTVDTFNSTLNDTGVTENEEKLSTFYETEDPTTEFEDATTDLDITSTMADFTLPTADEYDTD